MTDKDSSGHCYYLDYLSFCNYCHSIVSHTEVLDKNDDICNECIDKIKVGIKLNV